jgi:hypothetical protein
VVEYALGQEMVWWTFPFSQSKQTPSSNCCEGNVENGDTRVSRNLDPALVSTIDLFYPEGGSGDYCLDSVRTVTNTGDERMFANC